MDACSQGVSRSTGSEHELADATLLQICRAHENDPNLAPEFLADLRLVTSLVGATRSHRNAATDAAVTLLASVLGQVDRYNPTHLPCGYEGPTIRTRGWLDRDALERVGQQIVGLIWDDSDPEVVSVAVREAVSRAIRLGFIEQKQYDAWRPGMPSGSGWRSAVTATLYGVTRARALATQNRHRKPTRDMHVRPAPAPVHTAAAIETVMIFAPPVDLSPTIIRAPLPAASATDGQNCDGTTESAPSLQLGRPGEPCQVCGTRKRALTDAQYSVIRALQDAGEGGLTKDALEAVRASARRILKNLRQDPDWARVIVMPGQTNGRYRIRA